MRKQSLMSLAAAAMLGVTPLVTSTASAHAAPSGAPGIVKHHLCTPKKGQMACDSIRLENSAGQNVDLRGKRLGARVAKPMDAASPTGGYSPDDIQSAYNIKGDSSGGRTVAIVDAYGYSQAEADLATYRAQYGLPACTTDNGCLTVMNQDGQTDPASLPADDQGWDGEQALDLDAVSAACPDCKILLVQSNSPSTVDLGVAADTAAKQPGVVAISNSYGGGDVSDADAGQYYNHPGIAVTASTGDHGYQGPSFPSSSGYVTAVGGTTLTQDSSTQRGWSETAWSGAGSGCATENQAPQGQDPSETNCNGRASADVSADADPQTGIAVYQGGQWGIVGGTSLSSPLIASIYALSGNTTGQANAIPYANRSAFNDVTDGSNGYCADVCQAQQGWDGPTGVGTPNGPSGL